MTDLNSGIDMASVRLPHLFLSIGRDRCVPLVIYMQATNIAANLVSSTWVFTRWFSP